MHTEIPSFNSLPTDDAFWRHQILAACYQLAQSFFMIGSALAERVGQGEVGGNEEPLRLNVEYTLRFPPLRAVNVFCPVT